MLIVCRTGSFTLITIVKVLIQTFSWEKFCIYWTNNLYFDDLQANKKPVATGMFSADGEFVSFNKPVSLDNPVEVIMTLWGGGGGGG